MKVHVVAADLRAIAERLRRSPELVRQCAAELDKVANLLVASLEARELELRAGTMTMQRRGGTVVSDGRVLDASNLFRVKPA